MDTSNQEQSSPIIRSIGDSVSPMNMADKDTAINVDEELKFSLGDEELGSEDEAVEGDTHTTIETTNQEAAEDDGLAAFDCYSYYNSL